MSVADERRQQLRRWKKQHLIERIVTLETQLREEVVVRNLHTFARIKAENELSNRECELEDAMDIVRKQRKMLDGLQH